MLAWLNDVAAGRTARHVGVPGGVAYLHHDYPAAHTHNFVRLVREEPGLDAERVDATLGMAFSGSKVEHRVVEVHSEALTERLDPGLRALGYKRETDLIMVFRGGAPSSGSKVVELSLDERAEVATLWREQENPRWPKSFARQLGDRIRTMVPVAECTFLAVRDDNGTVVSRADLFRRNGIAQIEEVVTLTSSRNQGYATELVREGIRRAAGDDLIFIVADADDWPAQLYRRLGFEDLGRTGLFVVSPEE